MFPRTAIAKGVEKAAERLQARFGSPMKPEERLRRALVETLRSTPNVSEVKTEWRPEMPHWPWKEGGRKLGGFDVSIRFQGDMSFTIVGETKWTSGGLDALDQLPWDLFKLAHAEATLEGIRGALLIYAAPTTTWSKPPRFVQCFGDALIETRKLISDHPNVWRFNLKGGAQSRPARLPPAVQTGPVVQAPFLVEDQPGRSESGRSKQTGSRGSKWTQTVGPYPIRTRSSSTCPIRLPDPTWSGRPCETVPLARRRA